ncbi:endonuclease/exonuclease/phosphatase family protein [Streptomyces sp. NBC_01186]|uniref:endonuclease/exonuclease/phosphatase family protein n=1 Tax=unclassified Streptomyces TaxID=2593676 RepID=UPI002DDA597A|nr:MULTISPECIES: endonuclease/exonuclease/phosphatase family protein [unclassified Streptomyces]WSB80061.1 endonuclease/exonuclease/phosphatase family protein [Streptomyces sp. NBC_01775]WSS11730.1 endonuclease/exonuclease/phosphatase family protein [Streptomyces sp. NBC_01186]
MRVLSWNIRHGGEDRVLGGRKNLRLLLDQVVALKPDVFFAVETYGSGDAVRRALTERAGKGTYRAVQVTGGGQGPNKDNLWIFTRYNVVKVFPEPRRRVAATGFNTGGARVALPNGRRLNLVDTWLSFSRPWIGNMVNNNAKAAKAGRPLLHTRAQVAAAERHRQSPQLRNILSHQLPFMLEGDHSPVLMAGDLNTVPASDWSAEWARCPRHYGLSYALRTTRMITDAGFRDTYRAAHPNVCTHPGSTWSPLKRHHRVTPERIDYIFAKGRGLRVNRSFTVDKRLPSHPAGQFYSDHGAVVTDLAVAPR